MTKKLPATIQSSLGRVANKMYKLYMSEDMQAVRKWCEKNDVDRAALIADELEKMGMFGDGK